MPKIDQQQRRPEVNVRKSKETKEEKIRKKLEAMVNGNWESLNMGRDELTGLEETDQHAACGIIALQDRTVRQSKRALRRLENGTYPFCEACGIRITKARRDTRIEVTTCIACQREYEESGIDADDAETEGDQGEAWDKVNDEENKPLDYISPTQEAELLLDPRKPAVQAKRKRRPLTRR